MKETTRQKLIDATFDEVYSQGYQGAALADILKKAGVHKGSMYHFFANKKEMALTTIREKAAERFAQRYGKILEYKKEYLNEFIALIKETQGKDFQRGCPLANLVQEMSNLDEDFHDTLKAAYESFKDYVKRILDKAIEAKEMKECDTQKLALFIVSTLEGALLSVKASGEVQDYESIIDTLISMLDQYRI